MNIQQVLASLQISLARLGKRTKRVVRNSLKWLHLIGVTGLLYLCPMQLLEAFIVVILMFEIGFEFSALDRLIEVNNKLRTWVLRKFTTKRKKKVC
jgi:hypothetical protein